VVAAACAGGDHGTDGGLAGQFEPWTLGEPTVRIGGIEERGGVQLSEIRHLIALDDGTLFVRDSKTPSVLRFDKRGGLPTCGSGA
jgi:hypothetical protein